MGVAKRNQFQRRIGSQVAYRINISKGVLQFQFCEKPIIDPDRMTRNYEKE